MYHFRNVQKNEGAAPALHPTLAALFIVLQDGGDLSEIRRDHPKLHKHKYYKPEAKFPQDISNLLPAPANRWWETLGKSCSPFSGLFSLSCTAADACQRQTAPDVAPHLPKVRLLLPEQAVADEDDQMDVDELEGDDYVPVSNCVFPLLSCFLTVFTSPLGLSWPLQSPGRLLGKLPSRRSARVARRCLGPAL